MFVRSWFYLFGEAFRNLLRNCWMSIAAIVVVALTLLLLGSFVLLNNNINVITEDIKDQVEIVIHVSDQAGDTEIEYLRQRLVRHHQIEEVRHVSREEAMERLKDQFGDHAHFLDGFDAEGRNPLRNSFEVKTKVPEMVGEAAADFLDYPWVEDVFYGGDVVETLFRFTTALRLIGLIFMGALAVTAVFLIAHTIRLNVFIRSREIMIMKYIGATEWFIRWPFLIEGLVLGLTGALIPLLVLYYVYQSVVDWVGSYIYFVPMLPHAQAMSGLIVILLPLGVGLGIIGSVFSVHRFLKV